MNWKNVLRTHAVTIGFAAASFLAGTAQAQEVDNTVWQDSANVAAFPQPARAAVLDQLKTKTADAPQTGTAPVVAYRLSARKRSFLAEFPRKDG